MNAATANILLSNKKQALNDFLDRMASGKAIPSLLDELGSTFNGVFFSSYNNPNFISFEMATINDDIECKLEFIDPKNEFESAFFGDETVYDSILGIFKKEERFASDALTEEDITDRLLSRDFFITFGLGDTIDSWSGVQKLFLSSATLTPGKAKKITLKFLSMPRPLIKDDRVNLYGEMIDLNFLGVDFDCDGYSEEVGFSRYYKGGLIYDYYNDASLLIATDITGIEQFNPRIDLHAIIVDTIKDYIYKATNGANVIVLLPDINETCSDAYKIKQAGAFNKRNELDRARDSIGSFISELNMFWDIRTASFPPRSIDTRAASFIERVRTEGNRLTALESHYRNFSYRVRLSSAKQEGIPELKEPLNEVILGINRLAGNNRKILPVLFSESDTTILDYWASLPGNWTINQGDARTWDPQKPTVIFGDVTMITDLLYAQQVNKGSDPIHWRDKSGLDSNYISDVKELFTKSNTLTPFGRASQVPDEFGYTDELFSKEELKTIEQRRIPVFKYNTSNSNVTDLTYNDEGMYLTLLNNTFSYNVNRLASAAADGAIPLRISNQPIVTKEALGRAIIASKSALLGPILSNEEIVEEIFNRLSPELLDELYPTVRVPVSVIKNQLLDYVIEIDNLIKKNDNGLNVKLSQDRGTDGKTLIQASADYLAQAAKTITIKTLPFFGIATRGLALQNPCILFYQDTPVLSQERQRRTGFNNFLTGVYALQGFRHKIGNKVESEFLLSKIDTNPTVEVEEQEIKPGKGDIFIPSIGVQTGLPT